MIFKNILLSCVSCLVLSGCYTQLAMFYPEPEIEEDVEEQFYETYSRAVPRPLNVGIYAQDGAGTPLSLAYGVMYNRFYNPYGSGYYNKYDYYNRYGYHWGYGEYNTYQVGGYTMYVPVNTGERKPRTFSTDRGNSSSGTNLHITRSNHVGYNGKNNNNSYGNSSNVSSNRGSSGGSSSSSSSSSSSGRRVTRRN